MGYSEEADVQDGAWIETCWGGCCIAKRRMFFLRPNRAKPHSSSGVTAAHSIGFLTHVFIPASISYQYSIGYSYTASAFTYAVSLSSIAPPSSNPRLSGVPSSSFLALPSS